MNIHPSAQVHPDAKIADDAVIGPWVLVEQDVEIGAGCRIDAHAQILKGASLGENCAVFGGAKLGGDPQSSGFDRDISSRVVIGDNNIFRENTTVHRSATQDGVTQIGDGNFLMVDAHVGHDSKVGNNNVLANGCLLGGFVEVGDGAFLGGGSGFHQFVRVGDFCMVRGHSSISRDVPHFVTASGTNRISGLNVIGIRRQGFSSDTRLSLKLAFNHMFRSGLNLTQALAGAENLEFCPEAAYFIDFFRNPSSKGICTRLEA